MNVTDDELVYDTKVLPRLVEDVIKSKHVTVGKVFAAVGAYDSTAVFKSLAVDNGILPCIKVRRNATFKKATNNIFRNLSIISQKKDLQRWMDSVR